MSTKKISKVSKDTDKIWSLMTEMDESDIDEVLKTIPDDQLHHFRTKFNAMQNPKTTPYTGGSDEIELLAFNIINVQEIYARRFAMTSLVGFIYQMMSEWEPPTVEGVESDKLISQNDPQFANIFNEKNDILLRNRPVEIYNSIIKDTLTEISKLSENSEEHITELLALYKTLYENQYKLNRFQHFCENKKLKDLNKEFDTVNKEKLKYELLIKMEQKRLSVLETKLKLRKKFEGSEAQEILLKNNDVKIDRSIENDTIDSYLENPTSARLTKIDKLQKIEVFEIQINNKNTMIKNNIALLDDAVTQLDILKSKIDNIKNIISDFNKKINKVKSDYKKIFANTEELELIQIDEYDITDEEYEKLVSEVKNELKIEITREEFYEKHRSTVKCFLDEYFRYSPNNHVQCAYKPNYDDKLRIPLTEAYKKFVNKDMSKDEYLQAVHTHEKEIEDLQLECEKKYERSVIPPDDTFCRWKRYTDNNFEYIKQATDDIYAEKSDFEFSIVPLKYFKGTNIDDLNKEADEWQRKYAKEFETDIYRAQFSIHNLLGQWVKNVEKTNFYTKETQIVKSIIEQSQEDARMGNKLMKERIKKGKAKNIEKYGEHDKMMKSYKSEGMEDMNVKHVDEIKIDQDTLREINNIDESKNDEIEVEYVNIKPNLKHKHRGYTKTGKFHIPAEKIDPDSTKMMNTIDSYKKIEEENLLKLMKKSEK